MSVSVDGSRPQSVSVKGNQLNVVNTLYLGGLPDHMTTRRINVRLIAHNTHSQHTPNRVLQIVSTV